MPERAAAWLAMLLVMPAPVWAQPLKVTIERMDVRRSAGTIELLLSALPDARLAAALTRPPLATSWAVQSIEAATGASRSLEVQDVIVDGSLPVLTLKLAPVEGAWLDTVSHTISVTFLRSTNLARAVSAPAAGAGAAVQQSTFASAPSVQLADVYFSGKITGTAGAKPKFSFEAKLKSDWTLPAHRGRLGYLIDVAADEGANVDPDRISAGTTYHRVVDPRPRGLILHVQPVVAEFTRNAPRTTNVLTTAQVEHVLVPTIGSPAARAAVIVLGGVELGKNLANALSKDEGSGFVGRARVAVNPFIVIKTGRVFQAVKASAFWDVRVLTHEEIDPGRPDGRSQPTMTKRTRQHLKVDVDLALNSFVSLTLQHRGGYLPPLYKKVKSTITLSLTFKGRWA